MENALKMHFVFVLSSFLPTYIAQTAIVKLASNIRQSTRFLRMLHSGMLFHPVRSPSPQIKKKKGEVKDEGKSKH
jgi:hypothetical protein